LGHSAVDRHLGLLIRILSVAARSGLHSGCFFSGFGSGSELARTVLPHLPPAARRWVQQRSVDAH
jgi:hypothetical protein